MTQRVETTTRTTIAMTAALAQVSRWNDGISAAAADLAGTVRTWWRGYPPRRSGYLEDAAMAREMYRL